HEANTANISEVGLFITKILDKDNIGKSLSIELMVSQKEAPLKIQARVVWVEKQGPNVLGFGAEFIEISPEYSRLINSFIFKKIPARRIERKEFLKVPFSKLHDKQRRGFEILDLLRRHGPLSKAEIQQRLDLNIPTITKYIDEYLREGLVREIGLDISTGGRRPSMLELNPDYGYLIGIEIDTCARYISAILTDFMNKIIKKIKLNLNKDDLVSQLLEIISELTDGASISREMLKGIGLGVDNLRDFTDIKTQLEAKFGLPVLLEDKDLAMIWAEKWLGLGLAGIEDIVYIASKDKCSFILDSEIYREKNNNIGRFFGLDLETNIMNIVDILNPKLVIINHGLIEANINLIESLKKKIKVQLYLDPSRQIEIIPSQLKEDAVVQGVVSLMAREIFISS
ncbi:MAG: winged helix-turn-helix transcriptional regulator, partial [Pseudomonadota bacterium]